MAIKLFYCQNEYDAHSGSYGAYITHRWDVGPHVLMRINRGDYLVAIDDATIPVELFTDPNVQEIGWEQLSEVAATDKKLLSENLGLPEKSCKGDKKTLFSKILKRKIPYFDAKTIKKAISDGQYFYIDLINSEMDLQD